MKVLLVEDNAHLQFSIGEMLCYFFGADTHVLIAGNLNDSRNTFTEHYASLDLILMDLHLRRRGEHTLDLIQEIRIVYQGPMVAISTDVDLHTEMIRRGCTHACSKAHLWEFFSQKKFHPLHT